MKVKKILFFFLLLFLFLSITPLILMLLKSIYVNERITFKFYRQIFNSKREWELLKNSLTLSFMTTILTFLIGISLGILFEKTDLPLRKIFLFLYSIPFLIPSYINSIMWYNIFGKNGILGKIFGDKISKITSQWYFGLGGCVWVLTFTLLPIVIFLTITYLKTIEYSLEEAGKIFSGWKNILKRITLPLILPGTLFSAMLVFLLSLGEFGIPNFLRFNVFPVESFSQFSAFYNFKIATATSTPLAIITLIIIYIEKVFLFDRTYQVSSALSNREPLKIELNHMKKPLFLLTLLITVIFILLPLSTLILNSFPATSYISAIKKAGNSLLRSLIFSITGATLLSISGFLIGYVIHFKLFKFWKFLDFSTILLFAMPGTVIGIGLITMWNRNITNFIYSTPIIILIGYISKYTAINSRISIASLGLLPPSTEEAAKILGAGWTERVLKILIPLSKKGIIAGWIISYIFCMKDVDITMLLYPPGNDTLSVRIFTLMANGKENLISALCIIMIIAIILPILIGGIILKKYKEEK